MTKIPRYRRTKQDNGIRVEGAGDKSFPGLGAAIAYALTRAHDSEVGASIDITEYGDLVARARRTEEGAVLA